MFRLFTACAAATLVTGGPWSLAHVSQLVEEVGGRCWPRTPPASPTATSAVRNVLLDDAGARTSPTSASRCADVAADAGRVCNRHPAFATMLWELLTGSPPNRRARPVARGATVVTRCPSLAVAFPDSPTRSMPCSRSDLTRALASSRWPSSSSRGAPPSGGPKGVVTPALSSDPPAHDSSRRRTGSSARCVSVGRCQSVPGAAPVHRGRRQRLLRARPVVEALDAHAARPPLRRGRRRVGLGQELARARRTRAAAAARSRTHVVATMMPGEHPLDRAAEALSEVAVESGPASARPAPRSRSGRGVGRGRPRPLRRSVRGVLDARRRRSSATRSSTRSRWRQRPPSRSARARRSCVVVAVRADLYDRPLQHPAIGTQVGAGTFPLPPMTPAELDGRDRSPRRPGGCRSSMTASRPASSPTPRRVRRALPLLQFTLAELYERRVDGRITAVGARGASAGSAVPSSRAPKRCTRRSTRPNAPRARGSVRPARRAGGRRSRHTSPSPRSASCRPRARATAERFVAARLLVSDREAATREPVVEVAHEALLTRWPRLRAWIEDDRQWFAQLQHLAAVG